jgi:acetoin utilization deacetylase AcuC-like enzyme
MSVLVAVDERFARHDPGPGHPERPERVAAVVRALRGAGIDLGRDCLEPRAATGCEIQRVHHADYVKTLERLCERGGGRLDADTAAGADSWDAATHAAGAGLAAIEALRAGRADAAFLGVRPPGHHAVPAHGMGFCLLNNIAISAAALVDAGERVVIVDWDAHHGNGTQDIFWNEPNVLYVSAHQSPLYPGTGGIDETGGPRAPRTTLNLPLPARATGDVYLAAFDEVVAPIVERFGPDWLLVSAGFDGHRADPITNLGLSAGDFADLTERVLGYAPRPNRTIVFLEGGYDLDALHDSTLATVTTLLGSPTRPENATSGGPGYFVVERARSIWTE